MSVSEFDSKVAIIRDALTTHDLGAVRLRGADWFAWATCGGSSVVDGSSELGVAEVLVTLDSAVVLTDRIDAARLKAEERPVDIEVVETAWADPAAREREVARIVGERGQARIASDRPRGGELGLPASIVEARLRLTPSEIERYRLVSRAASTAVSQALLAAEPSMTEAGLAALASEHLVQRGLTPVVVLVGGERRLPIYRHPVPRLDERLGRRAMLVVCARGHGLIANLTRFVYFTPPTTDEKLHSEAVAGVEAAALDASRPGATLGQVYRAIVAAYDRAGFPGAELDHHQGGLCGFRPREEVATPRSTTRLAIGSALAWNPSLPGAKIEDTVVVGDDGLEILTVDPAWPTIEVGGRRRPALLVRA